MKRFISTFVFILAVSLIAGGCKQEDYKGDDAVYARVTIQLPSSVKNTTLGKSVLQKTSSNPLSGDWQIYAALPSSTQMVKVVTGYSTAVDTMPDSYSDAITTAIAYGDMDLVSNTVSFTLPLDTPLKVIVFAYDQLETTLIPVALGRSAEFMVTGDMTDVYLSINMTLAYVTPSSLVNVSEWTKDPGTGAYEVRRYNPFGDLTKEINLASTALGIDQLAYTYDDTSSDYRIYQHDLAGFRVGYVAYMGPGGDATMYTPDDPVDLYTTSANIVANTVYMTENSAGPDGLIGTLDDSVSDCIKTVYNASMQIVEEVATSYDFVDCSVGGTSQTSKTVYEYDLDGRVIQRTEYSSDPATPNSYVTFEFLNESFVKRIEYTGSGTDNIWFNEDDTISNYTVPDTSGVLPTDVLSRLLAYNGTGGDNMWFTADDVLDSYMDYTVATDNNGVEIGRKRTWYNEGSDTILFTTDDEKQGEWLMEYQFAQRGVTDYLKLALDGYALEEHIETHPTSLYGYEWFFGNYCPTISGRCSIQGSTELTFIREPSIVDSVFSTKELFSLTFVGNSVGTYNLTDGGDSIIYSFYSNEEYNMELEAGWHGDAPSENIVLHISEYGPAGGRIKGSLYMTPVDYNASPNIVHELIGEFDIMREVDNYELPIRVGASISGTITLKDRFGAVLPLPNDACYFVMADDDDNGDNGFAAFDYATLPAGTTSFSYSFADIPTGNYAIYGLVDTNGTGCAENPDTGDFLGFYGVSEPSPPPPPLLATVNYVTDDLAGMDFSLFQMTWNVVNEFAYNMNGGDDQGNAAMTDMDENLYVTGYTTISGIGTMFALKLIATDNYAGDVSFGNNGVVTANLTGYESNGLDIALDGSGAVLVSGYAMNASGNMDMAVWKFDATGNLDTSFATNGVFVFDGGYNEDDAGTSIELDSSGNLYVAGYTSVSAIKEPAVWKLTSTGVLDTGFNTLGYQTYTGLIGDGIAEALFVDSWEMPVVAGHGWNTNEDMLMLGFDSYGSLYPDFGTLGTGVISYDGGYDDAANALAYDSQSKYVAVGYISNGALNKDVGVWKYDADGQPHPTFGGGNSYVAYDAGNATDEEAFAVTTNPDDGSIYVVGTSGASPNEQARLWEFTRDEGLFAFESDLNATARTVPKTIVQVNGGLLIIVGSVFNGTDWDVKFWWVTR